MYNFRNLEYLVGSSYMTDYKPTIAYFSKHPVDKYEFARTPTPKLFYIPNASSDFTSKYNAREEYPTNYFHAHSFSPSIFLSSPRANARFVDDSSEARKLAEEVFELMTNEKLHGNISINVLPMNDFRAAHSQFGSWNNEILGFSINGKKKLIFVREANLDSMLIVIGHEIGHVLTDTLPNKHDEEAKAFAFSIEWAKTIKKHNIGNLGAGIKNYFDFNPAKNGLHDIAFAFVDFMMRKGRKAIELHDDLIKKYISVFGRIY